MGSGLVTSESSSGETPDPEADEPAVYRLGRGLTFRARSQAGLRPLHTSSIGRVGRASLGFSLAVGRSRGIRPVVRPSDLNTQSLRPPTRFWRRPAIETHAEFVARLDGGDASATSPPSMHTAPLERRASWTDQVIERSAIGYVEPPPTPDPPSGYAPTGDGKLDRMMEALSRSGRLGNDTDAVPTASTVRGTDARRRRPTPRDSASTQASGDTSKHDSPARSADNSVGGGGASLPASDPEIGAPSRRGDTVAGHRTGPGHLGRAIAPRAIDPGEVVASVDALPHVAGATFDTRRPGATRGGIGRPMPPRRVDPPARQSRLDRMLADLQAAGRLPDSDGATSDESAARRPVSDDDADDPEAAGSGANGGRGLPRHEAPSIEPRPRRDRASPGRVGNDPGHDSPNATATTPSTERRIPSTPEGRPATPSEGRTASAAEGSATPPAGRIASAPRGRPSVAPERRSARPTDPDDDRAATASVTAGGTAPDAGPDAAEPSPGPLRPLPRAPQRLATGDGPLAAPVSVVVPAHPRRRTAPGAASVALLSARTPPRRAVGSETLGPDAALGVLFAASRDGTGEQPLAGAPVATAPPDESLSEPPLAPGHDLTPAISNRPATARTDAPVAPIARRTAVGDPVPGGPTVGEHPSDGPPVPPRVESLPGAVTQSGSEQHPDVMSAPVPRADTSRSPDERAAATPATARMFEPEVPPPDSGTTDLVIERSERLRSWALPTVAAPSHVLREAVRRLGEPARPAASPSVAAPSAAPPPTATPAVPPTADAVRSASPSPTRSPAARPGPASARSDGFGAGDHTLPIDGASADVTAAGDADAPDTADAPSTAEAPVTAEVAHEGAPGQQPVAPPVARPIPDAVRGSATAGSESESPIGHLGPADGTRLAHRSTATRRHGADVDASTPTGPTAARPEQPRTTPAANRDASPTVAPRTRAGRWTASEELAARFMEVLGETPPQPPLPLPTAYRPMAEVITGPRRVHLATDATSVRALRSVGKVAATAGDVIHLDSAAVPDRAMNEVVAHELTHIAHPSPAPRFFDGADSPEERRAVAVASIMASAPIVPTAGAALPRSSTMSGPDRATARSSGVIQRAVASSGGGSDGGGVDAQHLAGDIVRRRSGTSAASGSGGSRSGGGGGGGGSPTIQRWSSGTAPTSGPVGPFSAMSGHRSADDAGPRAAEILAALRETDDAGPRAAEILAALRETDDADIWFREQLERQLGFLLDHIEDRMIVEHERRGGRHWGAL